MKLFLGVLLCLLSLTLNAQQYNFINYNVSDGLAQSQVRDICQDSSGYLWVGTVSGGLSRFDGFEFVNYSKDDGLPGNNIQKLFVSEEGELWVCTTRGVAKFENQTFTPYYFDEAHYIKNIAEFQERMYFASSSGLIQADFDKEENSIVEGTEGMLIRTFCNYRDSILLFGTRQGVFSWDGNKLDSILIPGYDNIRVRELNTLNGKLYVSSNTTGLVSYDFKTKEVVPFNLKVGSIRSFVVDDAFVFGYNVGHGDSPGGAFMVEEKDTLYFHSENGLLGNAILCVFKDREDNVWIGTNGKGLLKFSGSSIVSYSQESGLAGDAVMSIMEDADDNLYFGTYKEGATKFSEKKMTTISVSDNLLTNDLVWCMEYDDSLNHMWFGTDRGLSILDENHNVVNNVLQNAREKIRTMLRLGSETVLLGGNKYLFRLTGNALDTVASLNINDLEIFGGEIYCASMDGLYVFNDINKDFNYRKIDLPEPKIFSLTTDFFGGLWIGTQNGLFLMSSKGKIQPIILDAQNKRSKNVFGLITSKDSSIWVSTLNAVYQIEYDAGSASKYEVFSYGIAEGIISEESNVNALYQDCNENIWVGTANGLTRIAPNAKDDLFDYDIPEIHITGVRLFLENIDYNKYKVDIDSDFSTVPYSIAFPHNKNHVTFDFIGINFKGPEYVQYEYRLIGVDEEWSPVSKSNYATYSFLQPGDYTFQVRAMNKMAEWSEIKELNVIILSPFWKTWWFIMLGFIVIIFIVIAIFRSRIKVIEQQQDNEKLGLENRLLFLEQRSLNASMNRHFIFNSLNSIQYFINSSDKLSANKFLSNFAKLIRMNLDSSAANNFIVTLQEEVDRIQLYLSLEKMRFSDKFVYKIDVSSELDTESIEIPSMILQPFVENSIIHGVLSLERVGEINVRIYQEFGEVVFEVTDNGYGIDNSLKKKRGVQEGDHESKGVEITNRRIEILRELTGENLMIIGPFQMNDDEGNSLGTKVILKLGGANKFDS